MTYNTIGDAVTMQDGAEGTLLAGRYRIVRRLGQGGMGSVWLAEDTQLDDKQFAIKMLPSILVSNKRAYRQLKDEALVAMKLAHPNIVQIRAFEENNGNPFLVMDYVDGQTLDDYLAEHLDGLTQRRRDAEEVGSRVPRDRVGRDGSTSRPQNGRGKAIAVLALSAALGASVWWWQANEKGTERTTETARTIDASRVSPAPSVQPAPSLRLVARIGGREIDGAKVRIGDKDYSTPVKWEKLDGGSRLGPYDVSYESGGKRYFGTFSAVAVDWRGPKEIAVALKEHTGPKHGDEKPLTLPGGATMKMIYVAPGSFMMGSDASDDPRDDDELVGGKKHKVRITKGFWLGKYEVTQDQWQSVMGDNPSYFKSGNRPVDSVSWEDAQKFIAKVDSAARRQFGGGARLPTEAEWEYACRAGTDTTLPNGENLVGLGGNNERGLNAIAWYGGNSCKGFELSNGSDCYGWKDKEFPGSKAGTHPVGQKEANNWGFHDMIGNVWEWCNDWYDLDYYKNSPLVDPMGPASDSYRVLRGGSWFDDARDCRSAVRFGIDPDGRFRYFGFRLCCSAGPRE